MPAARLTALRLVIAPAVVLALAFALDAQPPEPVKTAPTPKETQKSPTGIRLPDGTYLWTGDTLPDTITLSPQELQKLFDQVEQLKKQVAARKTTSPSGCAIRGKIEKRGESTVAALKLTYTFRTTSPRTAVALGGRRGFLAAAALDGGKLPILDTGDDGFVAMIETTGDHTLALDLEAPVAGRGTKTEIGFELGLPRAAITTLSLEPPPDVKQVSLTTRTPDPTQPTKPPEMRRFPALDVKRLAPKPAPESAFALGPIDQLELAWEPPAVATAQPVESVRSADFDIATVLSETTIETTAKVRFKGASREWRFVAPANAEVSVERAASASPAAEAGPDQLPVITKPGDVSKPVWTLELPPGSSVGEWVVVVVVRQPRAQPTDAKHRGPFAIGPFTALDVFRQTGTLKATTAANSRLVTKHGPELRQVEPPGLPDDDHTIASFKLATGPTTTTPSFAPLITLESHPLQSALRVKPTYRLRLTEGGWRVRAEVHVTPIRREIDSLTVELPAEWGTPEATPAEVVDGVQQLKGDGPRRTIAVRLTAGHKQPFDIVLDATVPTPITARDASVPLLRFPGAEERDTMVSVVVPDSLEVRGTAREWAGDQPLGWGRPLAASPGIDGKVPKAASTISGRFEHGVARVDLSWQPQRPDLTAEVRADVMLHDRQVVVTQRFKLKFPEGESRPVRFRAPVGATGMKSQPPLEHVGPGEWELPATTETLTVTYALPLFIGEGSRKVSAGLMWPAAATRTETTTRVWSNLMSGRTIVAELGAWREVPSEPTPERDSLPAVSLVGTGIDLPLVFELRDSTEPSAVSVWVERAAVQTSATEEGGVAFRVRYLLKRWLAGTLEVRLPPTIAGAMPEFQIDGRRVDPVAVPDPAHLAERTYRVSLPEARPGRTVVFEVRYQVPANRPGGDSQYTPPLLASSAYAGAVRWLVSLPQGHTALSINGGTVDQQWRWRSGMLRPTATLSAEELDRWFRTGTDPGEADGGDAVVARQSSLEPLRVYAVGRLGFVVVCSLIAFFVGWLATRLSPRAAGPAVTLLGGMIAVAAVLMPQAASQVASAIQPGVVALAMVLGLQAAARWYYRHRVTNLPGFTRRPSELEPSAPPSSRQAPRGPDSTGSHRPMKESQVAAPPSGTK